ncbi:glycosyltransferase family 2 protein [Pseudoalteromonas sp. bablab_jr011]|uniref:glycosyltransferase family 2 protein n=1 Tax=Pseudoalteromonas sp. bablab_jr011 TaxID=2755062 RepID=UPI0018F47C3F|nr:glycosyltransferase family 2 protein [Pseudoalteromonas sp. bablab_jr011]
MLFSIIIPAYNAEKYITRAVDSVINQSFIDFEVVIINDGSKDKTLEVINNSYHAHENVTIVDKINEGVSSARNSGLNIAKGEYIVFLDADDWVENGYLDYLKKVIENQACDGIVLGYIQDFGSNFKLVQNFKNEKIIDSTEYSNLFINGAISNNPWDKVFKRECYFKNNIFFPDGISMGEDSVVSAKLGFNSQSIYISKSSYVHYMQDTNGVTTKDLSIKNISDLDSALSCIISEYSSFHPSSILSRMYVIKMYNLTRKDNFKKLVSSPYYVNYMKHISNVTLKDFHSFKDVVKYYPLFFFSRINMLGFFHGYNKFFNFLYRIIIK